MPRGTLKMLLQYVILTSLMVGIVESTVTLSKFERVSNSKYSSELGSFETIFKLHCCIRCILTQGCASVTFSETHKRCSMGSKMFSVLDESYRYNMADWNVFFLFKANVQCISGSCFQLVTVRLTYEGAAENCNNVPSGHIADIKTEAEMELVIELLKAERQEDMSYHVWIGGNDLREEGVWEWSDYTPLIDEYTSWRRNEPSGHPEHCLLISFDDYLWNDGQCILPFWSVCQYAIEIDGDTNDDTEQIFD